MLDIAQLRKDIEAIAARLRTRPYELDVAAFNALEAERKAVQVTTEDLQARRNALSKQVGQLKSKGEDASAVMAEVDEAVAEAHRFALDSPPPDPAGALDDVWTVGVPR